ncbi:MAG TPA: hypothetical protein PLP29_05900 [Candidatus Ozemobacteraceae bacterium]|nr:hypothetical protein [Candidatus Ozemobacteraceae bacterium]
MRLRIAVAIIIIYIISSRIFAQEPPRERTLVTRPGDSAAFHRHQAYRQPGGSFTLRYRFESRDGAIHRICERIDAERDVEEPAAEDGEDELPDISVALRLQEDLTRAAEFAAAQEERASAAASETAPTDATGTPPLSGE